MSGVFWFQVKGGETLIKTATLSAEGLGCWMLLRIHLLEADRLPKSKEALKSICRGANQKAIAAACGILQKDERGMYCQDLEATKQKLKSTTEKRRSAGKKGAEARWKS